MAELLAALVLLTLAAVTVGALRTLPSWVRDMWRSDRGLPAGRLDDRWLDLHRERSRR